MSIDVSEFKKYKDIEKYKGNRVLFFGNMYCGKNKQYNLLRREFKKKGWIFDTLTANKLNNGNLLSRDEVLKEVAKYSYGIGVGRTVLEMNALGLRTLICARNINGIMTNDCEFEYMKENNFTDVAHPVFSNDIKTCIENFDKAIIRSSDVHDVLPILKQKFETTLEI
jgi:hypothetical protein